MAYYFSCPNCESRERFTRPHEQPNSLGCLLFVLGGWIPALLYMGYRSGRVQCGNCGYVFQQPSLPRTPMSVFATLVFGIVVTGTLAFFIILGAPEWTQNAPHTQFMLDVERAIAKHPRAVTIVLAPMVLLLTAAAIGVSVVSDYRYQKELKNTFDTRPTAPSEPQTPQRHGPDNNH